jgi:hypothetical protein
MSAEEQSLPNSEHGPESSDNENRLEAQKAANQKTIALLESYLCDDPEEQTTAWEFLKTALDEDRPVGFELFPDADNRS